MTWYYQIADDRSKVDVWAHTADPSTDPPTLSVDNPDAPVISRRPDGVPLTPDVPAALVDELTSRGVVDIFAIRTIAEALTGAGGEEVES